MTPALVALCGVLILVSGLLSGSETGLYAASRPRLRLRAAGGDLGAARCERLLTQPAGVLGALLIGNNLVNFALTAIVAGTIAEAGWPHAEWWTTLLLSPFMLIFAEMTPKNIARRRADVWMPRLAAPLAVMRWLLTPLVGPLLLVERLTGGRRRGVLLSRERLRALMYQGVEEGVLSPAQHELAHGVMRFADLPIGLVAVPWARAATVPAGASREECIAAARKADVTRLPVVDPASGAVTGLINMHDLIFRQYSEPSELIRKITAFSPETRAETALRRMGAARRHIALVGTREEPRGLVSLEDLVGALVNPPGMRAAKAA